jgi:hypothetical protein
VAWRSAHPHALVVDPEADRPSVVGSVWRRREKLEDAWDTVRIVGLWQNNPDVGPDELCVAPVEFDGSPVLSVSVESFAAAYTRADNDNPAERLEARLRELQARS